MLDFEIETTNAEKQPFLLKDRHFNVASEATPAPPNLSLWQNARRKQCAIYLFMFLYALLGTVIISLLRGKDWCVS